MTDAEIAQRCNDAKPGEWQRANERRQRIAGLLFAAFAVSSLAGLLLTISK